jgi:hypothetical protein
MLAGDTDDETFAHLRRSLELLPRFREDARRDTSPPHTTTRGSRRRFAERVPLDPRRVRFPNAGPRHRDGVVISYTAESVRSAATGAVSPIFSGIQ